MPGHLTFVSRFMLILWLTPSAIWAQSGIVAFNDDCLGGVYALRGDGSGRLKLPTLPPDSVTGFKGGSGFPLDVSTFGPVTALTSQLYAVQINDSGGLLTADNPVKLRQSGDPQEEGWASFSPSGDRVAFYGGPGKKVWIADTVRDSNGKITGLANYTASADLDSIGASQSDTNASPTYTYTGPIDFSPDGNTLVVTVYSDLWLLYLAADGHTLTGYRPLTRSVGASEFDPAFSPDGTEVAFTYVPHSCSRSTASCVPLTKDFNIVTLDPATGVTKQVITTANKGSAGGTRDYAGWSPDGLSLVFNAEGPKASRNSLCGSFVNFDLFLIAADGSKVATSLTNTIGSSVERRSHWGH